MSDLARIPQSFESSVGQMLSQADMSMPVGAGGALPGDAVDPAPSVACGATSGRLSKCRSSFAKKLLAVLLLLLGASHLASAQDVALRTNVLYTATTTLNAGVDFRIAEHWSGGLLVGYNPWQFSGAEATWASGETVDANRKIMHVLAEPEVKWWPCRVFERHNFGLHGILASYNVAALPLSDEWRNHRYEGSLYGVGLSWGYQWAAGDRWGIELDLGAGYLWTRYHSYEAGACGADLGADTKGFFAPTKVGVSVIYYIH
jgi:opacity protein-like surface antigen